MSESTDPPRSEISLVRVWSFIWRHRAIIATFSVISAVAAGALSSIMTPKYRSEVVFSPADSSSGLGDLGGQLGGLAALAGINIGGGGKKSDEMLEYLRSRTFTAQFIQRHSLMPVLFAKKWDAKRGQWRGDPPTIAEGVGKFALKVRQIAEDRRTGIVTVAIIWSDRVLAAQWANALIAEADDALRQRGIAELTRSLDYLKAESAETSEVEVRSAVYKLMETELKNAMLARTRDAYAFKILDPAVVRDPKDIDSPNKPLIVFLGLIFGFLFGVVVAGVRQRRSKRHRR
jgi:uncharacterized protein involved in exopolysaccharide biosynthesis